MDPKIPSFQNFQKAVWYVMQLLVVNQRTKFQVDSSIFDPQMSCFLSRKSYQFMKLLFQMRFFVTFGFVRKKQMIPEQKLVRIGTSSCPHL